MGSIPRDSHRSDAGGMLEQLLIFTRGGLILWCNQISNALKGSPIDALIRSCLLEERSADAAFSYDAPGALYTLKWAFDNELGLVFVAVYQRFLNLTFIDDLLSNVRREFAEIYDPKRTAYPGFDETFGRLQREAEARAAELKKSKQAGKPALPAASAKKNGAARSGLGNGKKKGGGGNGKNSSNGSGSDDTDGDRGRSLQNGTNGHANGVKDSARIADVVVNNTDTTAPVGVAFDQDKIQKLIKGSNIGDKKGGKKKGEAVPRSKALKAEPKKKENRVWVDDKPKEEVKLDFTNHADGKGDGFVEPEPLAAAELGESRMDKEDESSESEEEEAGEVESDKPSAKKKGWFSTMFQSIAGNAILEKSDLEPALKALKDRLMTKNVAEEIAEKLCESVAASLQGKKLGSFTRVSSTVQTAMEEALLRILTPRRSIDILREVHDAKEQGRPYVIVFIGVNGVGKSTNLAKVAYWLQQHGLCVMMAACDTFRSGAVEQLRTHACRLKIDIFEKGYEKDPAVVAKEAIQHAAREKADVVLVDTAGRMQGNDPLMKALSKLINLNNPDLVLFVGEALVGNDAVDQLTKFNQKLIDLSPTKSLRLIDGILLTKFDTIDDKVGAALSMVYISGAPVMFVGCGQSYTDLKKLNVKTIVKTLLK